MKRLVTGVVILGIACAFVLGSETTEDVRMFTLSNGLKVLFKKNPSNNILAVECFIDVFSAHEDRATRGITNLIQHVLLKGTKKRTAFEIAEEMESIGGSIDTSTTMDYAFVSAVVTVEDIETAFDLVSDVLFKPTFPKEEIEKERAVVLSSIRLKKDNKFSYTYTEFLETMYEGHPYEFPVEGTEESVNSITRKKMVEFYRKNYAPERMTLSIVGNVEEEELREKVKRWFGSYKRRAGTRVTGSKTIRPRRRTKYLTKDIEQGFVVVGYGTTPAQHRHYPGLKVASAILGNGMSSRLFTRLRDEKGLAYSVGCAFPSARLKGHVFSYIGTNPETIEGAVKAIEHEFELMATEALSAEEIDRAKNYLIGSFLIDHQTNARQAWYLGWYETIGLGYEYDRKYPEEIRKVSIEDVAKICKIYFKKPTIVILEPEKQGEESQ